MLRRSVSTQESASRDEPPPLKAPQKSPDLMEKMRGPLRQLHRIPLNRLMILLTLIVVGLAARNIWRAYNAQVALDNMAAKGGMPFEPGKLQDAKGTQRRPKPTTEPENPVVFWTTDYNASLVHDLKALLEPLGAKFIDKSLSPDCHKYGTCAKDLRVLTPSNGLRLSTNVKDKFAREYELDNELDSVDVFLCIHPVAMCELYMGFNKSMIIYTAHRYELGRTDPVQWNEWNKNLHKIHDDDSNFVIANNRYDAEYMRFFTGIQPILLPSYFGWITKSYDPKKKEFLLAPMRQEYTLQSTFLTTFEQHTNRLEYNIELISISETYPDHSYSDLVAHPAIVYAPHQVSMVTLFEHYRMNIPLFFPSKELLVDWHIMHGLVEERTWHDEHGHNASLMTGVGNEPNPKDDDEASLKHWLQFADYYQWPHIEYYKSVGDLVKKLASMETGDFEAISNKMKKENANVKKYILEKWTDIIHTLIHDHHYRKQKRKDIEL